MKFKNLFLGPIGLLINNEKIQHKQEEVAYHINSKLGDAVKKSNEISRNVEDMSEKLAYTIFNALESSSISVNIIRKYFAPEVKEVYIGDHLFVQRTGYTHHGLYYGGDKVIHYLSDSVTVDSLEEFADGSKILKKSEIESSVNYSSTDIIRRAKSRLKENKYNVIFNNCEHFVRWCRSGGNNQ